MTLIDTLNSSIEALSLKKVRTFLTMLGVIIGVFSIVTLVSLVRGVQNYVTDQFNEIGSNLILVTPGRASFKRDPAVSFSDNKLKEEYVDIIIRDAGEYIVGAVPNIRQNKTVKFKNKSYLASTVGTSSKAMEIINLAIDKGRFFTNLEESSKARVAIIGQEVAQELFGQSNPLSNEIKIGDERFTIIGVLTAKGFNSDERVIMPYTTLKDVFNVDQISGISVKAKEGTDIEEAMNGIELALLGVMKKDEFTVISQKDILSSFQQILLILEVGLSAVAAISLLVGGIGIMNIMLVSVTERTQEIGLRKAVGATANNITLQFLVEASVVSAFGGFIGLFFAWLATFVAQRFIRAQTPVWAIFLGLGFSVFVVLGKGFCIFLPP